jgi:SAM-dependent methyltransferase
MDPREWDERYLSGEGSDGEPEPLVVSAAEGLAPGYALDLACGTGRNAIWLAERGWTVTAVDRSVVAIEALRRRAADRGVTVEAVVADLEKGEYRIAPGRWDLIVVCRYLQRDLFPAVRDGVVPGGVVVAVALMHPAGARFRAQPGELAAYFEGWEVLHYREGDVAEIAARRW